jgi:hypothetical protein
MGCAGLLGPYQNNRKIAIETRATTTTPEISRFTMYANMRVFSPGNVSVLAGGGSRSGSPHLLLLDQLV